MLTDRRILDEQMKALVKEVARDAARKAGEAALRGEV